MCRGYFWQGAKKCFLDPGKAVCYDDISQPRKGGLDSPSIRKGGESSHRKGGSLNSRKSLPVHPETESEPHTSTMQTSYTYETTMSTSKSSSSRSKSEARCSSVSSEVNGMPP